MLTISQLVLYQCKYVGFQYVPVLKRAELSENCDFVPTAKMLGAILYLFHALYSSLQPHRPCENDDDCSCHDPPFFFIM